jgi:UDP-N-acetylmuramate: L-alanyl-gamma-D-glutamyl-meso-diaminopimelate ligase
MKLGTMKSQLPDSLREVDAAFCWQSRLGCPRSTGAMGDRAIVEENLDRLVDQIVIAAKPGDHILVMSNGGFGGIHGKLLAALSE